MTDLVTASGTPITGARVGAEFARARKHRRRLLTGLVLAGLLIIVITRLPLLLSPALSLDPDESGTGLMALRLQQHGEVSLFYWGQRYALSIVEDAFGAAGFALFGRSAVVLKAAILACWGAGWVAFAVGISRLAGLRVAAVTSTLLASCPTWIGWAAKARSGYVTAFLLTGLVVLVAARLRRARPGSRLVAASMGALTALAASAQPIFVIATLPLLWPMPTWRSRLWFSGGFVVLAAVLFVAGRSDEPPTWAPHLFADVDAAKAARLLPARVFLVEGGSFLENLRRPPRPWALAAAITWSALALLGAIVVLRSPRRRLGLLALGGIAATLAFSIAVSPGAWAPRYLLPLAALSCLLAGLAHARLRRRNGRLAMAFSGLIIAAMIAAWGRAVEARDLAAGSAGAIEPILAELDRQGIDRVYALDPFLQHELIFASGERVYSRWILAHERRPEYGQTVDAALLRGDRVALVGRGPQVAPFLRVLAQVGLDPGRAVLVDEGGMVYPRPAPDLLRLLRFEFDDPASASAGARTR